MAIFALFYSFCQVHSAIILQQLSAIIAGTLCVPHTITMRNIARWSTCSYRTVQRFFNTPIQLVAVGAYCRCHDAFIRKIACILCWHVMILLPNQTKNIQN